MSSTTWKPGEETWGVSFDLPAGFQIDQRPGPGQQPGRVVSPVALHDAPALPAPVGPLSRFTFDLVRDPLRQPGITEIMALDLDDPLGDLDFQLSLYCLHELHYRSFAEVHADAEWHPSVVDWWYRMAGRFEAALLAEVPIRDRVIEPAAGPCDDPADQTAGGAIAGLIDGFDGRSLSQYVLDAASVGILREFAIHRSAYQLKEADPHSFALPRFGGRSKDAFVEIQMDEYGNGVPGRAHADLFARTMVGLGLDPAYGHYLPELPATTLATTNLISHLALHRRLLTALLGHLALFEMTSVGPMGRYAEAMRAVGAPDEACEFYDVHVVADAHHGPLARSALVDCYVRQHPGTAPLTVWGAEITMAVEARFTEHLVDSWSAGSTSLLPR